jgi:hypothetical protein
MSGDSTCEGQANLQTSASPLHRGAVICTVNRVKAGQGGPGSHGSSDRIFFLTQVTPPIFYRSFLFNPDLFLFHFDEESNLGQLNAI